MKCNNINVNVNGLELEVLPPSLSILLTGGEADANAYSYGSGTGNYGSASSGSEINDFRFICINNNNNTVIEEPTEPLTCEECFKTFLTDEEIEQFGTSLAEVCLALMSEEISEEQFVDDLVAEVGVPLERANNLVECLIEAGIEFSTGIAG